MTERLLPRAEVERLVGFKRSAIYARMAAGTFPLPLRDPETGAVRWLESEVTAWIAEASGDAVGELMRSGEDGISTVIAAWYHAARARGEPPDPVAEDLAAEILAEDAAGQHVSLPPGRA